MAPSSATAHLYNIIYYLILYYNIIQIPTGIYIYIYICVYTYITIILYYNPILYNYNMS